MRKLIVLMVMTSAMFGQTSAVMPHASATPHKAATAAKSEVDIMIDLVKRGMSESLVIRQLQREGKTYNLSTPDLLKLQKAGVSENIINAMMDPKASIPAQASPGGPSLATPAPGDTQPGGAGPAPSPLPPAINAAVDPAAVTPFPVDIPVPLTTRKRRVVVATFDFGGQKSAVQPAYTNPFLVWYASQAASPQGFSDDVGTGIRALVMGRLQQANMVTVLERNAAVDDEPKHGLTAKTDQGHKPLPGRMLGADCVVTGTITVFGRDDKTSTKGGSAGGVFRHGGALEGFGVTNKEEKAVVAIEFRIVDAETSEVLLTANARGESKRKSKTLGIGGLGGGRGGVGGGVFQNAVKSSGFAETILGEATIDAVDKIVKTINEKIPQLPAKLRKIEGRVATIIPNGAYLALGSNDGVLLGDRFAIMQINNEILDPETKDVIDVEAVKVGELVVNEVRDKAAIGVYGGQPLSSAQLASKGYQARLMTK